MMDYPFLNLNIKTASIDFIRGVKLTHEQLKAIYEQSRQHPDDRDVVGRRRETKTEDKS